MTEMPTHLSVTDTLADVRRYFESFENHNCMVKICISSLFEMRTDKPEAPWEKWYTARYDLTDRAGFLQWRVEGEYLVMPGRNSMSCPQRDLRAKLADISSIELYQPRTTLWEREFTK